MSDSGSGANFRYWRHAVFNPPRNEIPLSKRMLPPTSHSMLA